MSKSKKKKTCRKIVLRPQLLHKQRLFICSCLALGYDPQVIAEMFQEKFDRRITRQAIRQTYQFSKKWRKVTGRLASYYEHKVMAHPAAKKITRLNWILDAVNEALKWRLHKLEFHKGKKIKIMKRNVGLIPSLVREARAEIEGDKALVETHQHIAHIYLPEKRKAKDVVSTTQTRKIPRA